MRFRVFHLRESSCVFIIRVSVSPWKSPTIVLWCLNLIHILFLPFFILSSSSSSPSQKVRWVQQQHEKIRKKRDYQKVRFPGAASSRVADPLSVLRSIAQQSHLQYRNTDSHLTFPDPLFKEQWYMVSSQVCVYFCICCIYYYTPLFNLYYRISHRLTKQKNNH